MVPILVSSYTQGGTVEGKCTHVRIQNSEVLRRLRREAQEQDRSIRSVVTIALQRYFEALDKEREAT